MKFIKTTLLLLIIFCNLSFSYSLDVITLDDYETVDVVFNGEILDKKASAKIVDGNLMLPMRTYFEILGASIKWVDSTREVISYKNNTFIKVKIDSDIAFRNGREFKLISKPVIIGEATYIPARFISDTFDLRYNYSKSKEILSLDLVKSSVKFDFIKDDYFKRIPFDDLGVYISVPQLWQKSEESTTRYEYTEHDMNYSLDISSSTLRKDQTIEDYINEIKKAEFEIYSTNINYTGSYEDTINGINATVISDIIKDTTKEIRFILKEANTVYTLKFNYSLNAPETETIDTINLIAKSFQISNFTVNYADEHYIEYDALHNNELVIEQDIYSSKDIKNVMKFSGTLSDKSLISKLKVSVSKDGKTKSYVIAVNDGKFDGKIYAPFTSGKHNYLVEAIWKDESELANVDFNKNESNASASKLIKLNEIDSISDQVKKLNTINPKLLEFSFIKLNSSQLEYLLPSEKVQKDDLQISSLSNLLTYEELRKFDKAKAIFDWTNKNISIKQVSTFDNPKNSIAVFDDEYGNSLEVNILYTSLLRSIDIPSRIILATNDEGTSYYYNEIKMNGEWFASDPVAAIRSIESDSSDDDISGFFISNLGEFRNNFDRIDILDY